MKYTKQILGKYLGLWVYKNGTTEKYFGIKTRGNDFEISWGNDPLTDAGKIAISDSEEVYKRILSKARQGYQLEIPWLSETPKCYDEFDSIQERLADERENLKRRKPRKRDLTLLEWMSGMEEIRENE